MPHPANFTPLTGIALFGASRQNSKWAAYLIPMSVLLITDLFLGFHSTMPFVYGSFLITAFLGRKWISANSGALRIGGVTLASASLFFLITNFGVWATSGLYSKDLSGLVLCYEAAIPFFRNMLLGDFFYVGALFGLHALVRSFTSEMKGSEVYS